MVFNKIKAEAFNYKIELLFCIELLLSFLPIQVFFKFCLMITFFLLFLKMWLRWLFAIFFVIFFLLVNYSVFIVDKDIRSREKITFYTVSGTVKGDYLEVGDVVVGIFECKKESFFEECTLKREFFKMRVPFYSYLMKFRNERVNQLYYGSGKKVTLIQAMFYGDRSFLSNEVKENFTIAGLNHLLAISGQHVGIIVGFIFVLLWRVNLKIKLIVSSVFIFLFIPIAGFKIPILRAALFLFILTLAYLYDLKVRMRKLVLWVATIFILIDPNIVNSPSFVLSFLAVYGISLMQKDGAKFGITDGFLTGVYATAFTVPYVLLSFGMANVFSVLNSMLITPFVSIIILLGVFSMLSVKFVTPSAIFLEDVTFKFVDRIVEFTEIAFLFKRIPAEVGWMVLGIMFCLTVIGITKPLILSIFLIVYPVKKEKVVVFPYLVSSKGYFVIGDVSEVFFKGSLYEFRSYFIPELIKYGGGRVFDYGYIELNYKSRMLKIKKNGFFSGVVCVDKNGCRFVLLTSKVKLQHMEMMENTIYVSTITKFENQYIKRPVKGEGLIFPLN